MPSTTIKIKGNRTAINFKNNGSSEFNDVIHERVFNLGQNNYAFVLEPNTDYWRFGLRLFKSREIPFSVTSRHIKEGNIDIQLAVGTWYKPENRWENGNQLELGQYDLQLNYNVLDRFEHYESLIPVEFAIRRDSENILNITYKVGEYQITKNIIISSEFRYFKIFAWADKIDFDLDCIPNSNVFEDRVESFNVINVAFRKADLFSEIVLRESDLIILPCSSSGSIQPAISDFKRQINLSDPFPREAGEVEIIASEKQGNPKFWGWGYSVDADNRSTLEIIKEIIERVLSDSRLTDIQTVSLPLLGTGAGKLNSIEVANLYCDLLNSSNTKLKFFVAINNNQLFEELFEHFNSTADEISEIVASFTNKFTFRDKNDIEPILNVKDIADELVNVINGIPHNETEGMIGIFGKWGRGKSFLIKELWRSIQNTRIIRVDFHAWKYQDTPAIWGYLFDKFIEEYYSNGSNWINKIVRRIALNINRIGISSLLYFLIPFSISIYWSLALTGIQKWTLLIGTPLLSILILYYRYGNTAKVLFWRYTQKVSFVKLLGIQAEVQKELIYLIKTWYWLQKIDKIVLFVEDIDRCSENKIIETIDALRVMLEEKEISSRIIVVTAIDESILKRAIKHKYSKLVDDENKLKEMINEYLDKLFIISIKLGQLSQGERDAYFIELTKKDRDNFEVSSFTGDNVLNKPTIAKNERAINKTNEIKKDIQAEINYKTINEKSLREIPNESKPLEETNLTKEEKIKQKEFEILRSFLLEHKSITPRQIRVFYFRYIIAKNLLERIYKKNNLTNKWARDSYSKIFIKLLITFSEEGGRELLERHRIEVLNNNTPKKVPYNFNFAIDTTDYRELLNVLDLVIAY